MKLATVCHWRWIGVFALGMALGLMACAPKYYAPPAPPLAPAPTPAPPQVVRPLYYIKANRLNLRACPGMDCPKISVLERGEEVEKIGASEDWFQIRVKRDGRLGWVDSRYLSSTPVTPGPEAAPAPPPLPIAPPAVVTPPEKPAPPAPPTKPPAVEKPPKPAKPTEEAAPPAKKKPEEAKAPKPAKPAKPEEEAEPAPKPEKPAKPEEKPAPPTEPEGPKKIRIM